MPNTFLDPFIGYVPSGQIVVGGDPTVNWEAIGFGANGRPNPFGLMTINLCSSGDGAFTKVASLQIAAGDILSIMTANQNSPTGFVLSLREVAVCSGDNAGNTQEARMVILGSQIYPTGGPKI
jgi:hypothetical protein